MRRERRTEVTPRESVAAASSVQVKTEWDRLDSRFMAVSPTRRAACPHASSRDISAAAGQPTLGRTAQGMMQGSTLSRL